MYKGTALEELVYMYLRKHRMVGELHPWKKDEYEKYNPIVGLLIPMSNAFEEVKGFLDRPDMPLTRFKNILELYNIQDLPKPDDLVRAKIKWEVNKQFNRREDMPTIRMSELLSELNVSQNNCKYSSTEERVVCQGRKGYIYEDIDNPSRCFVYIEGETKRKFNSIQKRLPFLHLLLDQESKGKFRFDGHFTTDEATEIRKILGLRQKQQ